jgi:hypothetical protein
VEGGVIAALAIGLMIPLAMIQGAVAERRALRDGCWGRAKSTGIAWART